MSEQDQAVETVAGWMGVRPQREVMVAILMAVRMTRDEAHKNSSKIEWKDALKTYTYWADEIIKFCKENPP